MRARIALFALVSLAACGSDSSTKDVDMSVTCTGGPKSGAQDAHCIGDGGPQYIAVDQAQCTADAGDDSSDGGDDYGATMFNTSGYDDDCKYHVSYTVAPICEGTDTYFVATLTSALTSAPIAGAMNIRLEAELSATHPLNTAGAQTSETSPGVYMVGPVRFDASGTWTVRFHFYESCTDTPASPHGHAAFFVDVP